MARSPWFRRSSPEARDRRSSCNPTRKTSAPILTARPNLLSDGGKRQFDRAGHYNRLPPAAVDELEEKARTLAMDMLTTMNKLALEKQEQADGDETADRRFTVGAYIIGQTDESNGTGGEEKGSGE